MEGSESELVVSEATVHDACGNQELPELGIIEQVWDTEPIPSERVAEHAARAVETLPLSSIPDGGEVAVAVGSRGINNLAELVRGAVGALMDRGYDPFVFPAMGSHGGATAEGQREMLAELGVTASSVGCEIRSSMTVVELGRTSERDIPVVAGENAVAADAILPVNRIKPHTDFDGPVESGLSKMLVIGIGKQRGAKIAHEWAVDWSLREMIPEIASRLLDELPVIGGIAIVEDERDETARVEGIAPSGFLDRERELLELAYERMPTIPFDELDVLVLDRQGKEISGQGMDTNVIGRRPFSIGEPEPASPNVKRIFVRGLTEATHGNAMGMGSADVVHADVLSALDASTTLINALTATTVRGVRLPPVVENDRAGLTAALATVGITDSASARVVRAPDTMHLRRMYASPRLVAEAKDRDDLRVAEEPSPVEFTAGEFAAPSLREE